jgi:hypothetical protein
VRLRADAQEKSRYSREESVFTRGIDSKVNLSCIEWSC